MAGGPLPDGSFRVLNDSGTPGNKGLRSAAGNQVARAIDQPPMTDFIQELEADGAYDSSGQFTLDRASALRKLAQYKLPRPQAWILKLVQAGVLGGADSVAIRLLRDEIIVDLPGLRIGTAEFVFASLADPEIQTDPVVQALKEGFWGSRSDFWVDLGELGAFQARAPRLEKQPGRYGARFRLPIRDAAQRAEICHELRLHAYPCPIPLTLDKRRLDALQACPVLGEWVLTDTSRRDEEFVSFVDAVDEIIALETL